MDISKNELDDVYDSSNNNIDNSNNNLNLQIIEIIEKILGYQLDLKFVEDRKGHDRAYGLLTTLKPKYNLTKY